MYSREIYAALSADTYADWSGSDWDEADRWRHHVQVLQEYVHELRKCIAELSQDTSQNAPSEHQMSTSHDTALQALRDYEAKGQNVRSKKQVSTSRADAISRPNSRVNETKKAAIESAQRGET